MPSFSEESIDQPFLAGKKSTDVSVGFPMAGGCMQALGIDSGRGKRRRRQEPGERIQAIEDCRKAQKLQAREWIDSD